MDGLSDRVQAPLSVTCSILQGIGIFLTQQRCIPSSAYLFSQEIWRWPRNVPFTSRRLDSYHISKAPLLASVPAATAALLPTQLLHEAHDWPWQPSLFPGSLYVTKQLQGGEIFKMKVTQVLPIPYVKLSIAFCCTWKKIPTSCRAHEPCSLPATPSLASP